MENCNVFFLLYFGTRKLNILSNINIFGISWYFHKWEAGHDLSLWSDFAYFECILAEKSTTNHDTPEIKRHLLFVWSFYFLGRWNSSSEVRCREDRKIQNKFIFSLVSFNFENKLTPPFKKISPFSSKMSYCSISLRKKGQTKCAFISGKLETINPLMFM